MKILLLLLCCLPLISYCEIYQWQDEHGKKHFSDRSHPQAKIVEVNPGIGHSIVKQVYDGDTVVLEDGRKIRLLGINTPEVKHKNKMADVGGNEAKQWLENKLKNGKVRLVSDEEKTDKYGRVLAHLFTETNIHINLELVAAGLAQVNIYPPNLLFADELIKAQDKAEQNKLGIWGRDEYAIKPISTLALEEDHSSWLRLEDRVSNIRYSRKYAYLALSEPVEVRIERKWLHLFPDITSYLGKTIETRGWLSKNNNKLFMLIRHPSAIKLKNPKS